jgi:hypothetical protein
VKSEKLGMKDVVKEAVLVQLVTSNCFSLRNFASGFAIFAVFFVFHVLPQSTQRISQRAQSKMHHYQGSTSSFTFHFSLFTALPIDFAANLT